MPKPRKNQVCLDSTSYYHCISRCVRRAFLCGEDEFSGQSYEHRKQWVVDKLAERIKGTQYLIRPFYRFKPSPSGG